MGFLLAAGSLFISVFVCQRGVAIAGAAAWGWLGQCVCVSLSLCVCVCMARVANGEMCAAMVFSDIIAYGLMV